MENKEINVSQVYQLIRVLQKLVASVDQHDPIDDDDPWCLGYDAGCLKGYSYALEQLIGIVNDRH